MYKRTAFVGLFTF